MKIEALAQFDPLLSVCREIPEVFSEACIDACRFTFLIQGEVLCAKELGYNNTSSMLRQFCTLHENNEGNVAEPSQSESFKNIELA